MNRDIKSASQTHRNRVTLDSSNGHSLFIRVRAAEAVLAGASLLMTDIDCSLFVSITRCHLKHGERRGHLAAGRTVSDDLIDASGNYLPYKLKMRTRSRRPSSLGPCAMQTARYQCD